MLFENKLSILLINSILLNIGVSCLSGMTKHYNLYSWIINKDFKLEKNETLMEGGKHQDMTHHNWQMYCLLLLENQREQML